MTREDVSHWPGHVSRGHRERLALQRHFSVLTKFAWCHTAVCANAYHILSLPKAPTDHPRSGSL